MPSKRCVMSIYLRGGRTKMPAKSPMIFAIVSIKLTHVGFRAHVKIASLVSLLHPSQSGAGRCDERVCLSVCLFVCLYACLLAYLRNDMPKHRRIFRCSLLVAVARFSSGSIWIRYVLPVAASCLVKLAVDRETHHGQHPAIWVNKINHTLDAT